MPADLEQLGRYHILTKLGAGSHASVYHAIDTLLNRPVALKILKPSLTANPEIGSRFLNEARAAANLFHPQIAWVFDMGEIEGWHYLAMRFVEGTPLDRLIFERGTIPWHQALAYLEQIGSALDYAHRSGMIHRDVKPKNVIVSECDGAVLTDFGLVKALGESSMLTMVNTILGTPNYISPEVWKGDPACFGSDQYALGCVFVEMLTGRALFEDRTLEGIIYKHLHTPPLWNTWPSGVPLEAEKAISRALEIKPVDRFPDVLSFVKALRDADREMMESSEATNFLSGDQLDAIRVTKPHERGGEQKARGFRLELRNGPGKIGPIVLEKERIQAGRGSQCEVFIDDPEVSRVHAIFVKTGAAYSVQDNHSTNGTFVNGKRITGMQALSSGDEIWLGKRVKLVFLFEN